MHHDGCGGRAGEEELLTGIGGASSRQVRRIVLIERVTPGCEDSKPPVIPARAGTQPWGPAFAGITRTIALSIE